MTTRPASDFQTLVLALQSYWADQGCVIWQPHHSEVGAGTMNPATFLRVLGPEPWRVAYVEPSIRPADGRYGENPNRWQHYYQLQVILKPDPGDPQELYLGSLLALGIDPAQHDIRFVEDNWESPALGAWGLGWEVWLDGQEITQYTYFQQAGGVALDPVSVEITYGLERIAMALQDARSFVDLRWAGDFTYGDLLLQAEREHSRYNFEAADIERLRGLFEEYAAEAQAGLAAGLLAPAHDYVLKCSHTFNVLDARGAIGVTERAALFGRMRELSRGVAQAYLAQREQEGFPWAGRLAERRAAAPVPDEPGVAPTGPAPFVLEIGTEELPAADLEHALQDLAARAPALLAEHRLAHAGVRVQGTPRRLVLWVDDLAPRQPDHHTVERGPAEEAAFDLQGRPTAAARGWARKHGLDPESDLRSLVEPGEGRRYLRYLKPVPGRASAEVLAEQVLPALLGGLTFEKAMRWIPGERQEFSRPVRWLLALHGGQVVPLAFAGLRAGRTTRGLRFSTAETLRAADPAAYRAGLEAQGIVLDPAERAERIRSQVERLAAEVEGQVPDDPALLAEVTHLVEAPTALRGDFDPAYLELPRQVLVAVMRKHQRVFPVERREGLLPHFIAVRNGGAQHLEVVTHGNEQVVRARFADADYFVRRDRARPLESFVPRLATITFQAQLGSVLDKVRRLERLVPALADDLELSPAERETAARAAALSKADLATQMVVEMTSLQGEMGREYALASGEQPAVAEAILEHHLPRYAGDRLPESAPGAALALADRLDTLLGLFAAGLEPSGARDPFALRRAAMGLAQILIARRQRFDLRRALAQAAAGLPLPAPPEQIERCLGFIAARLRGLLEAEHRHDVVAAVLAAQAHDPSGAAEAVAALEARAAQPDWPPLLQAYARCARILRGQPAPGAVDPAALHEPAEAGLASALQSAAARPRAPGSVGDFLAALEPLVPAITDFFDQVLVMDEDPARRANRLALVAGVAALAEGVADLSQLEGF